ncbi:MAG TPA: hypothetical protein VGJ70_11065, partial [Solirubrobacteraceae bacterium]
PLALVGAPVAGAASWTAPAQISSAGDVQFDLAMGTDGTAAVAWVRNGVQVAIKRPGRPWSAPRRVSDGRFGVARPAVTVTGRGEVVVAWTQDSTPNGRPGPVVGPISIRARVRGTSGTWGTIRSIGTTGHFLEAGIDLAANARGEAIAVWRGVRTLSGGRRTEAVQSAFRRPRMSFGATQTIREPEPARSSASGAVVALDDRGTAYAAWTHGAGPVVRLAARSRGASGSWGTARTLGPAPSSNPIIAVTADRTAIVAWRSANLNSEGEGVQSGPLDVITRLPTGTLTARQRLSDTPVGSYRIAVAPDGEAVLSWAARQDAEPAPPGPPGARVATRPAGGGPFGAPEVLPGVAPADFHGGVAAVRDGTILLTWSDHTGRARVVSRPPGGTFSPVAELDTAGLYPLIASAGDRAVAVWTPVAGEAVRLAGSSRLP